MAEPAPVKPAAEAKVAGLCKGLKEGESAMGKNRAKAMVVLKLMAVTLVVMTLSCDTANKTGVSPQPEPPEPPPVTDIPANLDLNHDGTIDFHFDYGYYCTQDVPMSAMTCYLYVRSTGDNEHQNVYLEGTTPLPDSTLIDESIGWSRYTGWLARIDWHIDTGWDSTWTGDWAGVTEMNLALKLGGDSLHYGWVKLSVTSDKGALTIHVHAYQPLSEEPILAGVVPPACY